MAYDKGGRKSEKVLYNRRIRRLRKFILITVAAACLIPTIICVILSIRFDRLKTDYVQAQADLDWYRERFGNEMDILAEDEKESAAKDPGKPDIDYTDVDVIGAQNLRISRVRDMSILPLMTAPAFTRMRYLIF